MWLIINPTRPASAAWKMSTYINRPNQKARHLLHSRSLIKIEMKGKCVRNSTNFCFAGCIGVKSYAIIFAK